MADLDLRGARDLSGKLHLVANLPSGKSISYCYIRKNACSTLRSFFISMSPSGRKPAEPEFEFLARTHRAQVQDVASADYRICILRNPVQRCVSMFKNKFIQQNGHIDIFKSYEAVTGNPAETASFEDFVLSYMSHPLSDLDPHVWTQRSHLLPVHYNGAIMMDQLNTWITDTFGAEVTARNFAKKVNATVQKTETTAPASTISAHLLRREYLANHSMPSIEAFLTPVLRERLNAIYVQDTFLIDQISTEQVN